MKATPPYELVGQPALVLNEVVARLNSETKRATFGFVPSNSTAMFRRCLFVVTIALICVIVGCSSSEESTAQGDASTGVVVTAEDVNDVTCGPSDINVDLQPIDIDSSQKKVGIQLTLRDNFATCTISGHPGVEFIGKFENGPGGSGCPIRWTTQEAPLVTLSRTASAHAIITFLDAPDDVSPAYVRVELPNRDWGDSFPWEFGTVLCHNAATHPGTYIGTIQPGPIPVVQD